MAEYPRTPTPLTTAQAAPMLVAALTHALGSTPPKQAVELLMAQLWLENNAGKSFIQYNWGNHTVAEKNQSTDFWRPSWFTITDASSARDKSLHADMLIGKAPSKFRAFQSHDAGLSYHIERLLTKFKSIWEAALTGEVTTFAAAVQKSGYCPDCKPSVTIPTFKSFVAKFQKDGVFASLPLADPPASVPAPSSSVSPPRSSGRHYGRSLDADLSVLRLGSRGSLVGLWQRLIGIDDDDDFGTLTEGATKSWQKDHGLDPDGVVGDDTWSMMR